MSGHEYHEIAECALLKHTQLPRWIPPIRHIVKIFFPSGWGTYPSMVLISITFFHGHKTLHKAQNGSLNTANAIGRRGSKNNID
jgi:hypothetical protein